MVAVVPELGATGWVTDPLKQLDLLFSHALESDYSQDNIYRGKVTSIPHTVASFQQYPDQLTSLLQQSLRTYFGRYFQSVNVDVSYKDVEDTTRYDILLVIDVVRDGKSYNLTRIATLENGRILNVLKEINR